MHMGASRGHSVVGPLDKGLGFFEFLERLSVLVFPSSEPVGATPVNNGRGGTRTAEFDVFREYVQPVLFDESLVLD